jgi:hypothetical protein
MVGTVTQVPNQDEISTVKDFADLQTVADKINETARTLTPRCSQSAIRKNVSHGVLVLRHL